MSLTRWGLKGGNDGGQEGNESAWGLTEENPLGVFLLLGQAFYQARVISQGLSRRASAAILSGLKLSAHLQNHQTCKAGPFMAQIPGPPFPWRRPPGSSTFCALLQGGNVRDKWLPGCWDVSLSAGPWGSSSPRWEMTAKKSLPAPQKPGSDPWPVHRLQESAGA